MFDKMPSYLEIDKLMLADRAVREEQPGRLLPDGGVLRPEPHPGDLRRGHPRDVRRHHLQRGQELLHARRRRPRRHDERRSSTTPPGATSAVGRRSPSSTSRTCCVQKLRAQRDAGRGGAGAATCRPPVAGSEGYQRKLQEMRYAIQLEKEYAKNDILIGYLNIAHFGGIIVRHRRRGPVLLRHDRGRTSPSRRRRRSPAWCRSPTRTASTAPRARRPTRTATASTAPRTATR